jgi:uncharacterized membrane protein YidH (DUF202 family)
MSIHADEGDRGTQVERTMLAWNRAAIALAANGALLLRAGFAHALVVLEAFGVAIALAGFALWALSLRRYSKIAGRPVSHLFGARAGSVTALAVFIGLLSLVDLAVVVFTR